MTNLLLSLTLFVAFQSTPVSMSIRAIDRSFALETYPLNWETESHVDKAFTRLNGEALEVVSHCNQYPGKYFKFIEVGDALGVRFSDETFQYFIVSEIITVIYDNPVHPHNGKWIANGISYTDAEFTAFIMRPNVLVLHASICSPDFWYAPGQQIIIAQVKP